MISSSVVFGLELVDEFSLFEGGGKYGNLFLLPVNKPGQSLECYLLANPDNLLNFTY